MFVLAKLELTLLIIVKVHVHEVLRLIRILWLTLIVSFSVTALYEPSSRLFVSHSSASTGGEYIFYACYLVIHFS